MKQSIKCVECNKTIGYKVPAEKPDGSTGWKLETDHGYDNDGKGFYVECEGDCPGKTYLSVTIPPGVENPDDFFFE